MLKGDLGKVYMIWSFDCSERRAALALDKSTWHTPPKLDWGWRSDPAKMGGGSSSTPLSPDLPAALLGWANAG